MPAHSSHRPVGLTQGAIVGAALRIIREHGVGGLSMRALARDLGVQAPTLYHHVRDKAALLDLISAEMFRSMERSPGTYDRVVSLDEWSAILREDVLRLRRLYADHPGLARSVIESARMENVGAGDPDIEPPELVALVRLGAQRQDAQGTIEAAARWTMATIAAESSVADPELRDRLFHDGLSLLLLGMVAHLAAPTRHAIAVQ